MRETGIVNGYFICFRLFLCLNIIECIIIDCISLIYGKEYNECCILSLCVYLCITYVFPNPDQGRYHLMVPSSHSFCLLENTEHSELSMAELTPSEHTLDVNPMGIW